MCLQAFNQSKNCQQEAWDRQPDLVPRIEPFSLQSSGYTVLQIFTKRYYFYPHFFSILLWLGLNVLGSGIKSLGVWGMRCQAFWISWGQALYMLS